jgi:uncharacterized YigZ family protein
MSDVYRTIADEATATLTVEGSRFLAEVEPVDRRDAAEAGVQAVREREHKASHHCSAYRIGTDGDVFHYDDDGEPSGTAGRPLLRQIDARDLTNTLVVVTRYFGGTELGTGGLARAYGDAADAALERASIVERVVRTPVRLQFEYDDTSPAQSVLRRFDVTLEEESYSEVTEWTVGVRASAVEAFVEAFTNALSARGEVVSVGERGGSGE